jgi:hypothetical protein
MKKIILLVCCVLSIGTVVSAQDRWRKVGTNRWDTISATKIDSRKIRFFYEYPYMDEQRQYLVKNGFYTESLASQIQYGRSGVIVDCVTKNFGIFASTELNRNKTPVTPGVTLPDHIVKFSIVEPETNMESILIDVCKYFK